MEMIQNCMINMIPLESCEALEYTLILTYFFYTIVFACDTKACLVTLIAVALVGDIYLHNLWNENTKVGRMVVLIFVVSLVILLIMGLITYVSGVQKKVR